MTASNTKEKKARLALFIYVVNSEIGPARVSAKIAF
jgi:hypothetical protein